MAPEIRAHYYYARSLPEKNPTFAPLRYSQRVSSTTVPLSKLDFLYPIYGSVAEDISEKKRATSAKTESCAEILPAKTIWNTEDSP
jgi:hypothetical protein